MNKKLASMLIEEQISARKDNSEIQLSDHVRRIRRDEIEQPVFYIGAGTCGLSAGADKTLVALRAGLAARGVEAEIVEVGCIGLCAAEPLLDVQLPGRCRISFSHVGESKVEPLLEAIFEERLPEDVEVLGQFRHADHKSWDGVIHIDEHPFFKPQKRLVLRNCGKIDPVRLEEYVAQGGYRAFAKAVQTMTPRQVCDTVLASGLRGRGGGGFPTGRKWSFALSENNDQKYMICNADEGDPGAFMDRAIIEGDTYAMLEGLAIAAYGIGANTGYIYIRAEYPLAIQRLKVAIASLEEVGLLGEDILGSGFSFKIIIKMGAGAFVCGEETALIHSIEGKRGMPRPRPPFPTTSGLFGKPTVINNVETLANVPTIIAEGAEYFASLGTEGSKGTKVFALSGKIELTGLVEVEMGCTIRSIIFDIGGGVEGGHQFKAVQMGGPSGGCIPESHLDIAIDYESLKTVGAMMGSGGMVVMDENTCMVDVAKFFMEFIQRESCGKCIPCREGTRQMLEMLEAITRGRNKETDFQTLERFKGVMYIERLANVIRDTSLCGLGQSAPNPILSTLHWFRDEYEAHIYERRCPAHTCKDLLLFEIDTEKCTGCTVCARKCPTEAILGTRKNPHHIVTEKCIGCGTCKDVCRFDAVLIK